MYVLTPERQLSSKFRGVYLQSSFQFVDKFWNQDIALRSTSDLSEQLGVLRALSEHAFLLMVQ